MAGAGYKLFSTGDVLTATDVNTYLMQQTVMVFNDAAARTTALSGVVAEGMLSYLKDTNAVEVYDGANWVASDDPNAIQNTIVAAKGDIIGASANDVPAVTSVGADGTTLVADSSTATGLAYIPTFFAGKNKIINGDFGVWQRGTTFNSAANGSFTADRFQIAWDSSPTVNASQQTFTPGSAPQAGYESAYFLRVAETATSASTVLDVRYRIEDVRTFAGQTSTLSFWAKADSARTLTLTGVEQNFGSGGSASVAATVATSTFSLTTSWQRFSTTITFPSISGKTIGTGSNIAVFFRNAASATLVFDLWGVQWEAGSTATSFQTATGTIQGELAACQRYYWRLTPGNIYGTYNCFGIYVAADQWQGIINHPVPMRIAPTALEYGNLGTYDGTSTVVTATTIAITTNQTTPLGTLLANTGISGRTANRPAFLLNNNNTAGFLGLSAEL